MAKILVIDDEEVVRSVIRQLLMQAGYEVTEAFDGEEGARFYRQAPADLVIVDIEMPIKSGWEVIQELNHDFPDVKFVGMTGYESNSLSRLEEVGVSHVFTKPFSMKKLLKAVKGVLEAGS